MPNGGNGQIPPDKPSGEQNSNGQMQTNNNQNSQNQSSNL